MAAFVRPSDGRRTPATRRRARYDPVFRGLIATPVPIELRTDRLSLTPISVSDAADMVTVLADPELYAFTGGEPPTLTMLESRYTSQVDGSGLPGEDWYNWIVRLDDASIGFVQATTTEAGAELAWVIGVPWQGHGYATEAAMAMRDWLVSIGVDRFSARIHPHHAASAAVAQRLELWPTAVLDEDGESIWASTATPPNSRKGSRWQG